MGFLQLGEESDAPIICFFFYFTEDAQIKTTALYLFSDYTAEDEKVPLGRSRGVWEIHKNSVKITIHFIWNFKTN